MGVKAKDEAEAARNDLHPPLHVFTITNLHSHLFVFNIMLNLDPNNFVYFVHFLYPYFQYFQYFL